MPKFAKRFNPRKRRWTNSEAAEDGEIKYHICFWTTPIQQTLQYPVCCGSNHFPRQYENEVFGSVFISY